jgi:glycosyltransferase involved in cell wall biosynthesis
MRSSPGFRRVASVRADGGAMLPLISVLIPSYNYGHFVTDAIDSVLAQTYPNLEVVVADNASTDDTAAVVAARYGSDPRVRYVRNATNIGLVPNFNYALTLARGEFVLWLSADDWILPRHLARLAAVFAREPQIDVVYTSVYFADKQGRVFSVRNRDDLLPFDYVDIRDELPEMLTGISQLTLPAALFRRALFDELGPMDEAIPIAADWELAVRLALAGKLFAFVNGPSACVRWHGANNSGAGFNNTGQIVIEVVDILAKFLDHPGMGRVRGRELTIARNIEGLRQARIDTLGHSPFTAAFEERFAAVRAELLARHERYEPARVRESKVSVIVPVVGPPGPALRALGSVAAQTFSNVQIVLLDQSPIPLDELLRGHPARDRITYARAVARRPGPARNLGLRLARGEYLAFLDEDNTIAPDHLEELVATIERTGGAVAASHAMLVVERFDDRFLTSSVVATATGIFRGAADPPDLAAVANALPLNAVLLHRRFHEAAGPFSDAWILEDFEYLSRLINVAALAFAPRPTLEVRMRVGLQGQALRNYAGRYLATLDALYAARDVGPELEQRRVQQRIVVEQTLARRVELFETPEGVVELIAALSGRSVFTPRS